MQEQEKVTHLCFTHIPVTNVKEASKWYEEMLGFKAELVFDTHAILQPDLHLIRTEGEVAQNIVNDKPAPRTAYFCNNIFEFNETLKKKNVQVEDVIEENGCGWTFEVYDPDGNRITIWKAI